MTALLTASTLGIGGCTVSNTGTTGATTPPTLQTNVFAPTSSATADAEANDYRPLLLTAADVSDAEDTFAERSKEVQPDGQTGASAFFVNANDTRAIADTVLIYPDAATAAATLRQAAATLTELVEGGSPKPAPVGTDGTVISGTSPDGTKAVTLLLFTEGRALVRLEFQSATGDVTTDSFVTNIAKMQQIALRVGLSGPP